MAKLLESEYGPQSLANSEVNIPSQLESLFHMPTGKRDHSEGFYLIHTVYESECCKFQLSEVR